MSETILNIDRIFSNLADIMSATNPEQIQRESPRQNPRQSVIETDEAVIRDLIEGWAKAVRSKNYEGILAHHSLDILMFDVPPPIQSKGIEAYRRAWDLLFGWYQDSPSFDIVELNTTIGIDVAFVSALMRCAGVEASGYRSELDFRLTIGLRKIEDQWVITHEHHSIPAE